MDKLTRWLKERKERPLVAGDFSRFEEELGERLREAGREAPKEELARADIKLGVRAKTAWRYIYEGRHSLWRLSHCSAVHRGLDKAYFAKKGLVSLEQMWKDRFQQRIAPVQLRLALG